MVAPILGVDGKPYITANNPTNVYALRMELGKAKRDILRARYDAAQTFLGNEQHWSNTDHLDPHAANSLTVRRVLRSRSRYEIIENNPFLKGTILTICNDFVGRGPRLQITDKRLSPDVRRNIEAKWQAWCTVRKFRQKLWQLRMAKITDGEGFMRAYRNTRSRYPVQLDFQVIECDRVSSQYTSDVAVAKNVYEVDGVRFDKWENPTSYYILHSHPGSSGMFRGYYDMDNGGDWVDARYVIHWFRKDRGWLRGIPETTPSLPLCAILRRYTLATARHAEVSADITAVLETESPAAAAPWTDGHTLVNPNEDAFDVFPIEQGMIMNLPYGKKLKQTNPVPLGDQYDSFVGSLLREITRPLLSPYNIVAGTSKDSNMASAVVDQHIYSGGQESERTHCQEEVCDFSLGLWWGEAILIPGYLFPGSDSLSSDGIFRYEPPEHTFRWDRVGVEHTDPLKVAKAIETNRKMHIITDRDIQETYFNRDVEEWQEQVKEDDVFRASLIDPGTFEPAPIVGPAGDDGGETA